MILFLYWFTYNSNASWPLLPILIPNYLSLFGSNYTHLRSIFVELLITTTSCKIIILRCFESWRSSHLCKGEISNFITHFNRPLLWKSWTRTISSIIYLFLITKKCSLIKLIFISTNSPNCKFIVYSSFLSICDVSHTFKLSIFKHLTNIFYLL